MLWISHRPDNYSISITPYWIHVLPTGLRPRANSVCSIHRKRSGYPPLLAPLRDMCGPTIGLITLEFVQSRPVLSTLRFRPLHFLALASMPLMLVDRSARVNRASCVVFREPPRYVSMSLDRP